MEFSFKTRVLTLRTEKRWKNACDRSVFAPKIRHTVAYIYNALMLLRCRICFKPATKIVLRFFNLIELEIDSP